MRRHLLIPVVLVGLVVLAACGDSEDASVDEPTPATPAEEVVGRSYQGGSIEVDGEAVPVPGGGTFEVTFPGSDDPAAGTLRAYATCNTFGGPYTLVGDRLAVDWWGGTERGCEPAAEEFDDLVKALLTDARLTLGGDTLTIDADARDGSLRAVLTDAEVVDPSAPVEGTTWVLDGIIDDDASPAVPIGTGPVTMTLDGGFLSVDTGCNGVGGDYVLEDSSLTVTVGPSTERWCGEAVDELEARLRALFDQPLTVRTERWHQTGTLLSLLDANGEGALFVPQDAAEG